MSRGRGYSSSLFGGLALGGRPLPGTFRIDSKADSAYKAVGPAYSMGFIPATLSRILTAGCPRPSFSAISLTVKPFIQGIYDGKEKKSSEFGKFSLDIIYRI